MHDHHIHLFASAAALASAPCGPPAVRDAAGLRAVPAVRPPDARGWVRGVGYHESVAGPLGRAALDALRGDVPVRVQHTSGQAWLLNARAHAAAGLDAVVAQVRAAHAGGRAVALHCTTRAELLFALAALEEAGPRAGDRLEHVHVATPECVARIARLGLIVCVQPVLIAVRRSDWLR